MKRQSKLQFTKEELEDVKLEKVITKSQKSAKKLDKAEAKIPKKKVIKKQSLIDEKTGKPKTRLKFEEVDKEKPLSKLEHAKKVMPARMVISELHKEIEKSEDDSISLKAIHSTEKGVEFTGRRIGDAYRSHKRKPYKRLEKVQHKSIKADVNYLYQKNRIENPATMTNPISKWQQKQAIKKSYIATHYAKGKTKQTVISKVSNIVKQGADFAVKAVSAVVKNPKVLLIIGTALILIVVIMAMLSSLSMMFQGALGQTVATSYTSEDEELIQINEDFTELETNLQERIANIESEYTGYDEYQYDIDEITHDPHQLVAYLTAINPYFTASEMQDEIQRLYSQMYHLTTTEVIETRYRTETRTGTYTTADSEGNTTTHTYTYDVQVAYNYYILSVKLTSKSINKIANATLTSEQLEMYNVYRQTLGNKPLLFGGGSVDTSPSTDLSGVIFVDGERTGNQAIVDIAMSQVGNVGGQPYWSWYGFEYRVEWCATFVSWVLNQAGYTAPKFASCNSQGVPYFAENSRWLNGSSVTLVTAGDVIFFDWDGNGTADHTGIVVGTDGSRVYTIEGNSGDSCKIRDYAINSSVIMGYGLMN